MTGFEAIKRARELGIGHVISPQGDAIVFDDDDAWIIRDLFDEGYSIPEKSVTVTRSQVVEAWMGDSLPNIDRLLKHLGLE